jgi:hypothetical protein
VTGGEGGIRTLDRVVRPYNGIAKLTVLGPVVRIQRLKSEDTSRFRAEKAMFGHNCAASVHHRDLSGTAPCESQVKIEVLTASGWRNSNSPAAPSQALKHDRALSDILPEG